MPNLSIIPARAVSDKELTGADIRVLCAIGIHTDAKTGKGCWANASTLAEEAGVSKNQFFISAKRLLHGGYVERESGQADGTSSVYSVILDEPKGTPKIVVPAQSAEGRQPPSGEVRQHPAAQGGPTINAPINAPLNRTSSARVAWNDDVTEVTYAGVSILSKDYWQDWNTLQLRIMQARGLPASFLAEMAMAAQGEHGYAKMTPAQLGDAVRGFVANGVEPNFRLFKAYLRDSGKPPKEPQRTNVPSESSGVQQDSRVRSLVKANELIERLKNARVQATEGVRVGHLYLPPNWDMGFNAAEVKAIKAAGTAKLLSEDETTASVAHANLRAFITGASL